MESLRWAMIGTGAMAHEFAPAICQVNGSIYAVGSRSPDKAREFAATHQVSRVYSDYSDLLQDPAVDVVYIATPHVNHYDLIMESLKENKHVLCEKAITVNSRQLQDIVNLADEKNRVVAEAMTIYHMPIYQKLHEIIRSGQLGPLKMIQVNFGSSKPADTGNRFFNLDLAGGALLDIGTYALSFARFFLSGQPTEILTTHKRFETGADEQSGILLKNSQEELAVIALAMRARLPKRGIVAGERGFITVDNYPRADQAVLTWLDGRSEVITAGHTDQALVYEVEAMNNCILNYSCEDRLALSVDVMAIMDEVRRQWGLVYPFE